MSCDSRAETPSYGLSRSVKRPTEPIGVFLFYGHGTDSEMIGQDRKAMIDLENAHLLRGWVVYAMACSTARILGPAVVRAGGLAYIGFRRHFRFIPWTAQVFGECVNNVVKELAEGRSCVDALLSTKAKFDYYIIKYKQKCNETSDSDMKGIYRTTYELLAHDKSGLSLLGDPEVVVNPR